MNLNAPQPDGQAPSHVPSAGYAPYLAPTSSGQQRAASHYNLPAASAYPLAAPSQVAPPGNPVGGYPLTPTAYVGCPPQQIGGGPHGGVYIPPQGQYYGNPYGHGQL